MNGKNTGIIILLASAYMLVAASAMAQSVFLKDGSIVEGRILTENDNFLTIKAGAGTKNIHRSEIIRTVYSNDYKTRVNVILMDGRTINGYVVEEGKDYYVVRKYLDSTKELRLVKSRVNGILKDKSAVVQGDSTSTGVATADIEEFPGLDVRTDKKVYDPFEKIVVIFANMPGGRYDWISLARKETPDNSYEAYYYTNRKIKGELQFKNGVPPGDYEVRVYLHYASGSYKVSFRYPFTVKGQ